MKGRHIVMLTLGIYGFESFDHQYLNTMFGITADKIHEKGKRLNPAFTIRATKNAWMISAHGYQTAAFDFQLNSILSFIEQHSASLKTLHPECLIELKCAIEFDGESDDSTPWAHFSLSAIALLNRHNVEIDFDFYLS